MNNPPETPAAAAPPMGGRPGRRWRLGVAAVAALGGALWLVGPWRRPGGAGDSRRPVVAVAKVTRGEIVQTATFQAELRPYFAVELHAKIAGFVRRLLVDIGSKVQAGELLAELEVPLLTEDIERARAALERSRQEAARAEAAAADARLAASRLTEAARAQPNLVAQQDLDTVAARDREAAATLSAAISQTAVARAELARLETEDAETKLTAPFAGVVTRLLASPGDLVQGGSDPSGQARPLVRLAQLDPIRLSFPVSTSYAQDVRAGDPVVLQLDDGRRMTNRISRVSGEMDRATRMMEAQVDLPNADRSLTAGMPARVFVVAGRRTDTLVVPVEAIRRDDPPTALVVQSDGMTVRRALKLGLEGSTQVEILEGLNEGDIITVGSGAKAGVQVEPRITPRLQ